ncbi:dUTP diphosphatase [Estrella lausannensis]|uniref:Deoxyuridine 5'-triphosphate nucleotidohydrolase n=1 Tax=Estrella lausannensis TaxID=483423 RepID=A0A0H5E354_9BACT|nr:dUTP diphosphatase [Estrella lausannensis]CRX37625.1 Deoxyuridine 5`-triphosphate nucleotidohydrolase [Estrella lausannensis]
MPAAQNLKKVVIRTKMDKGAELPVYASKGASGADVRAAIEGELTMQPGQYLAVPTGLYMDIPEGYEVQVRPRSGLALKEGVTVLNTPGTVDHDYRGELKVILINFSNKPFVITPGMRIAQLVVAPVLQAEFEEADAVSATARGANGFGSTGLN